MSLADPGLFNFFDDDDTHSFDEDALKQQTQARILNLQGTLAQELAFFKEQEQKIRTLQEEICVNQSLLGPAQALPHMEGEGFFDQVLPDRIHQPDASESPDAMTLVESGLDRPPPSQMLATPPKQLSPDLPGALTANDYKNTNGVSLGDARLVQADTVDRASVTGFKKRRRFSMLPASKKIRTNNYIQYHDPSISTIPSTIRRAAVSDATMIPSQLKDGNNPSPTTRPTSWPRSRLFRRSAGVSVKKLTDVFDKLR